MAEAQTPANPITNQAQYSDANSNPSPDSHPPQSSSAPLEAAPAPPPPTAAVAADNSSAASTEASASNSASTLKRRREEEGAAGAEAGASTDAPEAKRRVKAANDVLYRIVVPSRQIGKVIGKVGHRIQKIREHTKATIKIADAISRHEERVIIISSKDRDNIFSDAENALHQIVSLILQDDDGNVEATKVGPGHVAANTIRLLIAGSQAGGLIGVSGQNIENLRNSSGATITVLNPNQLPPCASAHESDRVVQISGEVPAVLRAVVEIGSQLRENPPKQVISVSPAPAYKTGFHQQPQLMDPTSADYVTLDLMVPENLVGGLIGRFGANISRIRNESGANVKVYGARGEQTQRQIRLSGSSQQVALAKQRVDEYVYAELMRQAGGQLQQVAAPQTIPDVSNTLYQGYGYAPSYYTNSNQEAGMMAAASVPPMYPPPAASTGTNQDPYYSHQHYPAPQL